MSSAALTDPKAALEPEGAALALFLENHFLVLRERSDGRLDLFARSVEGEAGEAERLAEEAGASMVEVWSDGARRLYFAKREELSLEEAGLAGRGLRAAPLLEVQKLADQGRLAPEAAAWLPIARKRATRLPYLYFSDSDYIYKFRGQKQRNQAVYRIDRASAALYQSELCEAIKAAKRGRERTATTPARLDFGAVSYSLPSHFGFCLGVQNAIERAYETLAAHPERRVFMLSELIHNPFVNEDLKARGLRYLQTDKGEPVVDPDTGRPYWESVTSEDVVVIPAFGAREEDKRRLIERGLPLNRYDATCMLVEKVWKAARRHGERGYTVIIHGKAEHEETKATFSNSAGVAPTVVARNLEEARQLGAAIEADEPDEKRRLFGGLERHASPGFDPARHLERVAVVNQTTLLRNETLKIIEYLETVFALKHGAERVGEHLAQESKGDTLCYATQVNQDALSKALEEPADAALVVGGRNSSNTFQLYRLCGRHFGERAHYIQSEANILSPGEIEHYVFPYNPKDPKQGRHVRRPFLDLSRAQEPVRILLTGGASCPDGILQQVIFKINGFFDPKRLRPVDEVIASIEP